MKSEQTNNQTTKKSSRTANTSLPASQAQTDSNSQKETATPPQKAESPKKAPQASTPDNAAPKPPKKKIRRLHQIPVTSLPEDEKLDEVLDDMLLDMVEEIPEDAPEMSTPKPQNLYARMRERREKQAEQKMNVNEVIRKKSGLSEDDVAMILELGYESELGRLVGYENLKKLKMEHLHRESRINRKPYRTAFGFCGEEYAGEHNKERIIATYLRDRKFLILRTLFTALATLLLLVLDLPWLFGEVLSEIDASLPLLFPILGTALLVGISTLSFRQLNAGLRSYLKLSPTPYSLPALILPLALIYDVLIMILQTGSAFRINFLTSALLLLFALCDLGRLVTEMRVFRLVAAEGQKYVLERVPPRKKKLRQGKKLVKIINDDIDEAFYRVRCAEEATGFFRRFNAMRLAHRPFQYFIALMLALSFLTAFFFAFRTESLGTGLSTFMTVLFLSLPATAVFGFFQPVSHANTILTHYNCALLGEESIEEYNDSKTVIFHDTDLYSAEKCTEISVRDSDELRRDLRLAGILFRKLGGTLASIGSATVGKTPDPTTAIVRVADNGVEAVVDNQFHIIMGGADFLKRSGIRTPRESTDKTTRRAANVSLMYVAIDGVLKLSYEIEYAPKLDFEELAARLADFNTAIAVQSYDPNLNEQFLQASRKDAMAPIRVLKPGRYESDATLEIADTGVIALGAYTDVVHPLHAAKRIHATHSFIKYLQLALSLLGPTVMIVLALLGYGFVGTLTVFGFQLVGIFLGMLATFINLNRYTLHLRKKNTNDQATA